VLTWEASPTGLTHPAMTGTRTPRAVSTPWEMAQSRNRDGISCRSESSAVRGTGMGQPVRCARTESWVQSLTAGYSSSARWAVPTASAAMCTRPRASDVRFEHVTFAHAGGSPLFTGLDLAVPGGTKLGLVGRSGGGKSTLTRLLLRMTDIQEGQILIGGQDISRLRQSDLRSLIAYVPQDPALFHRTLRDNIAFARPDATEAQIRQAAQAAHVTEFAGALPDGFGTMVGERGVKLSGGQRQRVALARAILRDAPILLLDEATSALDSESEILIQQALWRLMEGRTALVVAHRLSTVARMDQLVVLDRGQIAEKGTHSELLRLGGTYAKLWQHQSGGFLDDDTMTAMPAETPRLST